MFMFFRGRKDCLSGVNFGEEVLMARHTVVKIVDANTFEIDPCWKWQGKTGSLVKASGYRISHKNSRNYESAIKRLNYLILGKVIEMRTVVGEEHGHLVCDLYINGFKLSEYFPDI
jgi:hypothetical protein